MTRRRPRKPRLPPISEREFLEQVLALAKLRGWMCAHFRPARTARGGWRTAVQADGAGWVDLVLVRGRRAVFAELKVRGHRPTPAQRRWLDALRAAGLEPVVWTETDWPLIEQTLAPEGT